MGRHFFIIFVLLLFSNCKKGIDYVRGTVIEAGTGLPVENAKVYLLRSKLIKMPKYSAGAIDSATTNENGEFHIKYFKVAFSEYAYNATKENYFSVSDKPNRIKNGRTALTLELIPFSYIKIKFVKNSSSTKYICGLLHGEGFYSNPYSASSFSGPYTTFSKVFRVFSVRPNPIKWDIFDSTDPIASAYSFSNQFGNQEDLYVQKADTLIYTITF